MNAFKIIDHSGRTKTFFCDLLSQQNCVAFVKNWSIAKLCSNLEGSNPIDFSVGCKFNYKTFWLNFVRLKIFKFVINFLSLESLPMMKLFKFFAPKTQLAFLKILLRAETLITGSVYLARCLRLWIFRWKLSQVSLFGVICAREMWTRFAWWVSRKFSPLFARFVIKSETYKLMLISLLTAQSLSSRLENFQLCRKLFVARRCTPRFTC